MRNRSVAAAVGLVVVLVGCGGGGSSTGPTTTTTPPQPTQASLTVTMNGRGLIGYSPYACCNYRIQIPLNIKESAGLGANINYARLMFIRSGVERERQEISGNDVLLQVGTNHIAARGNWNLNMKFDFNEDNFDTLTLLVNFTDERGNVFNFTGNMDPNAFDVSPTIINFRALQR